MLAWLCLVVLDMVSNVWLDSLINPIANDVLARYPDKSSMRWLDCEQSNKPICWLNWSLKVNVGLTVNNLWNPTVRWLGRVACETHLLGCFPLQPNKPDCVGLDECYCTLDMYESSSVPLFLEEIMPSSRVVMSLRYWWAHWPMVGWNVVAT